MASGIFAILDDISMLMDDIASMSKLATKKTASLLADDLAVNAEKSTGFLASREIPVLWAITKGSFVNKLIILPLVFLLSYYYPNVIKYILLVGGIYLSYEGMHKVIEFVKNKITPSNQSDLKKEDALKELDESTKTKSAIQTDFILSIEIVIIALSTVIDQPLHIQIATVSFVAILATIGVYGIVALIVRMDDFGFLLLKKSKRKSFASKVGSLLVKLLPMVIKALSIIGTIALILVSGGIFIHSHLYIPEIIKDMPDIFKEFIIGLLYGTVVVIIIEGGIALWKKVRPKGYITTN